MDKDLTKRLLKCAGIPTPEWLMAPTDAALVGERLGWPVVVKPNKQGSTVGLSVVRDAQRLSDAVELAHQFDTMVEKFIPGREFTVGVLDGKPLPVGEIVLVGEVFDYKSKYQVGAVEETFPAPIPDALAKEIQRYALMAHFTLKLGSYSRMDFRCDAQNRVLRRTPCPD